MTAVAKVVVAVGVVVPACARSGLVVRRGGHVRQRRRSDIQADDVRRALLAAIKTRREGDGEPLPVHASGCVLGDDEDVASSPSD
jgi:hypothetical protein